MKTITVGRGTENAVTLDDSKTSRHQAVLRFYPSGKMEIVDMSQNGTFINGMRIASNKPYPVTKKDVVIFAHAEKLDWNRVPNPYIKLRYTFIGLAAGIIIVVLCVVAFALLQPSKASIESAPEFVGPALPSVAPKPQAEENTGIEKNVNKNFFPELGKKKKKQNTEKSEEKSVDNEKKNADKDSDKETDKTKDNVKDKSKDKSEDQTKDKTEDKMENKAEEKEMPVI